MKYTINLTILMFSIFFLTACAEKFSPLTYNLEKKEGVYSIKQAKRLSMEELVRELEHYPIIFVGDHHDTEKTHKFFEDLIVRLAQSTYKLNLANEWFIPEQNEILKEYTDDKFDTDTLKEKIEWENFTDFKWDYVARIYEEIKKAKGRLYGINLSKTSRAKISLKDFENMNEEEKTFYDDLDLGVTAHWQLVKPYLEHCNKMPKKSSEPCQERMYRVQVAWDTYMAQNLAKLSKELIKTPKDKLLVFAGAMHIEQNLGIPLRFSRLSNLPFITISNEQINEEDLKLDINKADIVYIYE